MNGRSREIALVVVGLLLIVVGLAADLIGLGPNPGLGWKQLLMAGAGAVIAIIGAVGLTRAR